MKHQSSTLWIIAFAVGIYGAILAIILLTGSIESLGRNIPQPDLLPDYAIGIIWSLLLGLSIPFWPIHSDDRRALLIVWVVKSFFVSLGFMLLYEANYPFLDGYAYFSVPLRSDFQWPGLVFGYSAKNIYSLVSLYYKVMPASYHALKVSFAMIGLIAVYIFYRSVVLFLKREEVRILYVLAFFPSILFWSSIIGKDPISLVGIALYVYGVVGWHRFRTSRHIGISVLGILIAMLIRPWLGLILAAPLGIFYLPSMRRKVTKVVYIVIAAGIMIFLSKYIFALFDVNSTQDVLKTLHIISHGWSSGGSGQTINADFSQIHQLLSFIPLGMFTALFRPLPGEVPNPFGLLAGLENLILLILLLRAVIITKLQELKDPIIIWASLFVLTWAIVYGFVSYQNFGTAVRFRLQVLPVMLCLLLYLGRRKSYVTINE